MKNQTYNFSFYISNGMTLVEAIVIVVVMGIVFLAVTGAFYALSRGVQYTKTRILANSLAAEKIEILKNLSYYRLMATKEADLATYGYDQTYYPAENIRVGDIDFLRTVAVYKVYEEPSTGKIIKVTNPDTSSDTDLKQIKVTVSWYQGGEQKSITIENLRENPDRVPLEGKIWGYVTSTGTLLWGGTKEGYNNSSDPPPADRVKLGSARVYVYENPAYEYYTDTNGKYEIKLPTGSWKLVVSKSGYWDYTTPSISVPKSAAGVIANVQLMQKLTGIVTGYVVFNDHLVISQIVASTVSPEGFDQEYIELYNPTTYYWQYASGATVFPILYIYNREPGGVIISTIVKDGSNLYRADTGTSNAYIPPYGFLLIANTTTVTVGGNIIQANLRYDGNLIKNGRPGAVCLHWWQDLSYDVWIDSVGWGWVTLPDEAWKSPIPGTYEGTAIETGSELFPAGKKVRRKSSAVVDTDYYDEQWGMALDTQNNKRDFMYEMIFSAPFSSSSPTILPRGGTPAVGAIVSCDDGVSQVITCWSSGTYQSAYFELVVATGTWTLLISSKTSYIAISSVTVLYNQRVGIPNTQTDPPPKWPISQPPPPQVFLSSASVYGYAAGYIGVNLSGIKVTASEAPNPAFTNSFGRYILPLLISNTTYIDTYITANPYPDAANNPSYTTESATATVYLGQITTVDFKLSQAGKIIGMVTTSAVNPAGNPLPGVVVKATKGTIVKTSVSESDGKFTFLNLSTGSWTVEPILDEGESSTPSSVTSTLSVGQTLFISTFVVSGAYGLFTGEVHEGGSSGPLVKTGVLILATTTTIDVSNPPEINMTNPPSIPYYFTVSDGKGQYKLYVRGGYKYNIYAWMTKVERYQIVVTPLTAYTDQSISAGSVVRRNIIFP
jgi:type II secretory pathway pseudopilin PulG